MWSFATHDLSVPRGQRYIVARDDRPATYADILRGWQSDAALRTLFIEQLSNAPYGAFRWETPAVTRNTLDQPFECVVLDAPHLTSNPDRASFAKYFRDANDEVTAFANLGGDAILVVPCPIDAWTSYPHLAAFIRAAPDRQRHAIWQRVAESMFQRISDRPVWLSTAGAGVAWLHVRLDDRPKYYGYKPYTSRA